MNRNVITGEPLATSPVDTPDLRRWLLQQTESGRPPDELLAELMQRGLAEDQAVAIMTATFEARLAEVKAKKNADPSLRVPDPPGVRRASVVRALDREVKVLFQLAQPRVILFGGLLSNTECDELVGQARRRMSSSNVIDLDTGDERRDAGRTSSGMAFTRAATPLIARIERRIAALLDWPLENGEALQILRYEVGQEYRPHHDYVDPAESGAAKFLARGGQRVASLVMYLNTPTEGGATNFPDIGLEVAAVKGNAVFFSYDRPHPSTKTLHGGMPVLAGEKWVATKWLRETAHH
jgi:prolyl 4-hydroxylase